MLKDLVVDRSALDRIIAAGGFISVPTGSAPDANAIPVPKENAELAMDAAACIGCGACVAACPNASAMLFTGGQGLAPGACCRRASRSATHRVRRMVAPMDAEGFGNCTNHGECEAACPKGITLDFIARMNRDFLKASLMGAEEARPAAGPGRGRVARRYSQRSAAIGSTRAARRVGKPHASPVTARKSAPTAPSTAGSRACRP